MPAPRQFINGHWVYGGAAQNVIIKRRKGWDSHHKQFAQEVLGRYAEAAVQELNETEAKPRIKIVPKKKAN